MNACADEKRTHLKFTRTQRIEETERRKKSRDIEYFRKVVNASIRLQMISHQQIRKRERMRKTGAIANCLLLIYTLRLLFAMRLEIKIEIDTVGQIVVIDLVVACEVYQLHNAYKIRR